MDNTKQVYENGSIQQYGIEKISQLDAKYNPFGFTEQQGCSTCRWFMPEYNGCHVIAGVISPVGISDLYMPLRPQDQMAELLADFAEEMAETDIGEASVTETNEKQKTGLIARFFSRGKSQEDKPLFDTPTGFKTVGDNMWIMWYSNPYQDRDKEWFAEKSLDADIAYMHEKQEFPSLWRYHVGTPSNESTKHGKALTVTKSGRFVIAIGDFDDTPLGHAMKSYYKDNPDQGVSHGFYYDPEFKKDGVYHKHHTFEVSTLPPELAANPYATFAIKEGTKEMSTASEKQLADLKAVLNGRLSEKEIDQVLLAAAQKSAELDQHVSYKSEKEEEKAKDAELSADTKALLGALGELKASFTSITADIAALKAKMDKPEEDDDEEEDEEEKPPKKKKSRATADSLSPEITKMLRGLVEDQHLNQDAKQIDERDLDPASLVLSKMFGGGG